MASLWCQPEDEDARRARILDRLALHVDGEEKEETKIDYRGDPRSALELSPGRLWDLDPEMGHGETLADITIGDIARARVETWMEHLEKIEIHNLMDDHERWGREIWLRAREVDLLTQPAR